MRRWPFVVGLVVCGLIGAACPAFASVGVGTDVASIEVTQPLAAGGTYQILPFTIVNTGSESSGFGIQVSPSRKPGKSVPTGWLTFQPSAVYLSPNQGLEVETVLRIPLDAAPGTYQALLLGVPKLPSDLTPGGYVSVGAGPRLTFTVVQPNQWQRLYFLLHGWMPWSAVAAVVACVTVVAMLWFVLLWRRRTGSRQPEADAVE
jgi:hypothetical protein